MQRISTFAPAPPPPAPLPARVATLLLKYWGPFQLTGTAQAANRRNLIAAITGTRPPLADCNIMTLRRICQESYGTAELSELHTRALDMRFAVPFTPSIVSASREMDDGNRVKRHDANGATQANAARDVTATVAPTRPRSRALHPPSADAIRATSASVFAGLTGCAQSAEVVRDAFASHCHSRKLAGPWRFHWVAWFAANRRLILPPAAPAVSHKSQSTTLHALGV